MTPLVEHLLVSANWASGPLRRDMEIKRFDIMTEIEIEALRLLLAADPEPEEDATMRQVQGLAILLKQGLRDKEHLRHDVLRVITGIPVTSQWGLSMHTHYKLINYLKEDNDDPKWALSLRGRRLLAECARVAEAIASEYEDDMDRFRAQAAVWDMWSVDSTVST